MARTSMKSNRIARAIVGSFATIGLAMTLLVVANLVTRPAQAQTVCVAHTDLVSKLSRQFSEQPAALGLGGDGSVLQLFTSKDGDTWTLVRVLPNGNSCMMAVGESWTQMSPRVVGRAS